MNVLISLSTKLLLRISKYKMILFSSNFMSLKTFFICWFLPHLHSPAHAESAGSLGMNDILRELSWSSRLKVLNEVSSAQHKTSHSKSTDEATTISTSEREDMFSPREQTPDSSVPESFATAPSNADTSTIEETNQSITREPEARRVGIQLLRAANMRANEDNDKDMRLKLFRLMYETVRDSDLKVKRAELIKGHYTNSSAFEIGYLVGDITDKANVITDISGTLKRFHRDWKPIEHINAYEQISNQAMEITHLIDLVRVLNKKDSENMSKDLTK